MQADIQEVTHSMSPKGFLIGSASEVIIENSERTDTLVYSSFHGRGIGLPLSPTHPFPIEDMSLEDVLPPSVSLDSPHESIIDQYSAKLDLTEEVIRRLSEPKRRLVDLLSDYDEDKSGVLPVPTLKKCLQHHSVNLTDEEFRLVFDGFTSEDKVNYIHFLKSWSDLSSEFESPQSIKRTSSGSDSIGYSSPKRRFFLDPLSEHEQESLTELIRLHVISRFGNVPAIFKSITTSSDSVYLSDLVSYFSQHQIFCTLSQLHRLLEPFMSAVATISVDEFQKFILSITRNADVCIANAFPTKFGRSTHISLSSGERSLSSSQGFHRTLSIAKNMNSLPLYRMMLSMNEQNSSYPEEQGVFI